MSQILTVLASDIDNIVVAKTQPELIKLKKGSTSNTNLFFANLLYAAGVEEGLHHFGVL